MPAGGSSTVACPADAVAPTVPTVLDNCNRPLTVGTCDLGADPVCAGTKTYTYTFTDCAGQTYQWIYTYTISAPVVTMPAGGSSTVACLADAVAPAVPTVLDNCNLPLTVGTPVIQCRSCLRRNKDLYLHLYRLCRSDLSVDIHLYHQCTCSGSDAMQRERARLPVLQMQWHQRYRQCWIARNRPLTVGTPVT